MTFQEIDNEIECFMDEEGLAGVLESVARICFKRADREGVTPDANAYWELLGRDIERIASDALRNRLHHS